MTVIPVLGVYAGILAMGAFVGFMARVLLRRFNYLSLSLTILYGIAGSGMGFTAYQVLLQGAALTIEGIPWTGIIIAILATMVFIPAAEAVRTRLGIGTRKHLPVPALIAEGESETLEFKSSERWNMHTQDRDERLEMTIVRTVAGFLNSKGGTLLIGVDDQGTVVGIENDLKLVRHNDVDRYQLWLQDLLEGKLGRVALRHVHIGFDSIGGQAVCRVQVEQAGQPVFLRTSASPPSADFYVRIGNSTRMLPTDEAVTYINWHWRPWRRPLSMRR